MADPKQARNPLTPWWIGLAVMIVAVIYAAYRFSCLACGPPSIVLLVIILGVMPAVYLALMYITLKDQGRSERHPPPPERG
jgi:hypothetical protein